MEVTIEPGPGPGDPPRAFVQGESRRAIEAVLDRWPGTDHTYLKVRADDGGTYILRLETATGRWEVWLFRRTGDEAGPPLSGD